MLNSNKNKKKINETRRSDAVQFRRSGLYLTHHALEIPLRSGAVHYWRLQPESWRPALSALVSMGLTLVETYVPWAIHERETESQAPYYNFEKQLDVASFLREAHSLGLWAILRPGPHINAELTCFGIPERILWNQACQARSPHNNPLFLPAPPRAFPVPSYASKVFLQETAQWFQAVGHQLRDLVYPNGPIVLAQVDNEGALYFRDGVYEQDYHPDALTYYREFVRQRYGTIENLHRVYHNKSGTESTSFDTLFPPTHYNVKSPQDLPRHLDWAESQEASLAHSISTMAQQLIQVGFEGIPLFHNLPMAESATPLSGSLLRKNHLHWIALDYYHASGDHRAIARRTSELVASNEAIDQPAFAAEMGAGFPPYFPPFQEKDAMFTVLCAMAYGLRGYNIYMAVERDRWLGSPVDCEGTLRPFAQFWKSLSAAWESIEFQNLSRQIPVRILIPRGMRRLARVMHAFGPASQTLFRIFGGGIRETVFEDTIEFEPGSIIPPPMSAARILVMIEQILDEEGIAYALVDGDDTPNTLKDAQCILVPTHCGLNPRLLNDLNQAHLSGINVCYIPRFPVFDESFRPLESNMTSVGTILPIQDASLEKSKEQLRSYVQSTLTNVLHIPVQPLSCAVTTHNDHAGTTQAVFFINPTPVRQRIEVKIPNIFLVCDLLDSSVHELKQGVFVEGHSVRFCKVMPNKP